LHWFLVESSKVIGVAVGIDVAMQRRVKEPPKNGAQRHEFLDVRWWSWQIELNQCQEVIEIGLRLSVHFCECV
jgi:hypothetical protein